MKTPAALVTAALTAAILLAASLLIATGTRGGDAIVPFNHVDPADRIVQDSPAAK
jgi:hypothetical protein